MMEEFIMIQATLESMVQLAGKFIDEKRLRYRQATQRDREYVSSGRSAFQQKDVR